MQRFIFLMFCFLAPLLRAQETIQVKESTPEAPYVEREERQINFYPGGKVGISTGVPGNLRIVGWKKGAIRLEAEKIVYNLPAEDAKALLKNSPIRVRYNQTSATIQTAASPDPLVTMETNLVLYVPGEKTDLKIGMVQGDLSVDSVNGWVEATLNQGNLEARSMAGYFSGSTKRGDIHVEMSGIRWQGLEFSAVTQQGSANIRLPAKYSAALQLETRNGKIVVHYPPQVVDGEETPPEILIHKNSQSLKASVGDGGAPVKLATAAGDVTLSLKEEE